MLTTKEKWGQRCEKMSEVREIECVVTQYVLLMWLKLEWHGHGQCFFKIMPKWPWLNVVSCKHPKKLKVPCQSIHPLSITTHPLQGHGRGWSLSQLTEGERQGTPKCHVLTWKNAQIKTKCFYRNIKECTVVLMEKIVVDVKLHLSLDM